MHIDFGGQISCLALQKMGDTNNFDNEVGLMPDYFNSLHAGHFFMLLSSSVDFFFFKKK